MDDVLTICTGGLGADQTWQIQQGLAGVNQVRVASAGGWDGYKTNLASLILPKPPMALALICHSFGCESGIQTCQQLAVHGLKVDYLCLLDPVSYSPFWASEMPYPAGTATPKTGQLWYSESPMFVRVANITGGPKGVTLKGTGHNSLCHSQIIISEVIDNVRSLISTLPNSVAL